MPQTATQADGKPPPAEEKPRVFVAKKDQPVYYHGERKNQLVIYEAVARAAEPGKQALHRVRMPGGRGRPILAEEDKLTTEQIP